MAILSFSVKEDMLKSGEKVRTTRRYTPEKYALWRRTLKGGDLTLQGWWKSRRPEGYKLFERKGSDLYRIRFINFGIGALTMHPAKEWTPMSNNFIPMDPADLEQWVREEGFERDVEGLLRFFFDHYENIVDLTFQSIAFRPEEAVE